MAGEGDVTRWWMGRMLWLVRRSGGLGGVARMRRERPQCSGRVCGVSAGPSFPVVAENGNQWWLSAQEYLKCFEIKKIL